MSTGAITSYIDVAQIALYAFWVFFAGLIFYLRREDRREGYPLQRDPADLSGRPLGDVLPLIPEPKTFQLAHGGTSTSGHADTREPKATRVAAWPGSPLQPTGDPMQANVGPGAYAERADEPEMTLDGRPLIVPLRVATDHWVEAKDPDPRGMEVVAGGQVAGTVRDLWVDRAEPQVRYLEVELPASAAATPPPPAPSVGAAAETPDAAMGAEGESAGAENGEAEARAAEPAPPPAPASSDRVLLPIYFSLVRPAQRRVEVNAILAKQFAGVPRLRNPDQVTKLEEDKITAYYAAGKLYAEPSRLEPLL